MIDTGQFDTINSSDYPVLGVGFELSEVAMVLVDDSLRIVRANPAASRLLVADPLVGQRVTGFSIPSQASHAEREILDWLNGNPTHVSYETDLLVDGETLRAELSLDVVVTPSGRRSFLAQLRDVTAERRQHQLLTNEIRERQRADNPADRPPPRIAGSDVVVTAAVLAAEQAEPQQAAAGQERLLLLRRVTDSMATSRLAPEELCTSIATLASTALGDGAILRILSPDLRTIEQDVIAHPDLAALNQLAAAIKHTAGSAVPGEGLAADVVQHGRLISKIRPGSWKPEYQQRFRERIFAGAEDFMIAPVRHNGTVLGMFAVIRTNPDEPYRAGDDDVLQVLADGAGAVVDQAALPAQRTRHARRLFGSTCTVVTCDDQQEIRDALRQLLSDVPRFQLVGEAGDGATCLDRVWEFRPDVLIMDFSMPGGGPRLARAVKEIHPATQIIVFSGHQDARTRDAMLAAGADQYVVKTGRPRQLLDALDQAFPPHS